MTAPTLERMKFWIVVPKYAENQIKNPTFAHPDFEEDWTAIGTGVTIEETGDEQRWGAYSMKANPAAGVSSGAYHGGLTVETGLDYTFSCYVKGVAGQAMRLAVDKGITPDLFTKTFTASGYWQRVELTFTSVETSAIYRAKVLRDAVASTAAFYVDGCQFEQDSKASTFFDGYSPGCRWTGAIRNSTSARSANTGLGGELLCINDYAAITKHIGFGMGQWNQILTKMTSGGDMYQTHIRKSRTIALNLAYTGNNHGELQANRKVIIDALRPDLLSNLPVNEQFGINMPSSYRGHEQRIIRYQGFDANGNEATQPIDIVCVFEACHSDTPDTETSQRDVLLFTVPSGLFQGAYNEGKVLDLYANFPAERIVKRDPQGNWCKWNGTGYDNSLKGQGTVQGLNGDVYCMAEGPDGKIYVGGAFTDAGGVAAADNLARWNPLTEAWEAVVAGINQAVRALAFDANGDLYVGGSFTLAGGITVNRIMKVTKLTTSPTVNALGTGASDNRVSTIVIAPDGKVCVGGHFQTMNSVADTLNIAIWDGTSWSPLNKGLGPWGRDVKTIAFAPDGTLWAGGSFTNADGVNGDYICWWDGANFRPYWQPNSNSGTELNYNVMTIAFDHSGKLLIGGDFTNAGGIAAADYIARYNGGSWEALGSGTNNIVYKIIISTREIYVVGYFTTAGGLTLTDRVAVWANGAWQPLDIDLPGTASVYSILPASDGSLYIGGAFSTVAETPDENAKTGVVALNFEVASASANTYPVISVTGPGTLKSIINYRTGKTIAFDGLTLQAGEWIGLNFDPLQLSFRSGWAGRGNLMRYVVPGSDYGDFYVSPGANYLSIFMDGTTTASKASITYVPKFWGLDGALL